MQNVEKIPSIGTENAVDKSVARPPVEPLVFSHEPESKYWAVASELWSLIREMKGSPKLKHILALTAGLVTVLLVNMVFQVYLNNWNGAFYRAIEQKNVSMVWHQTWVALQLIAILLTVVVSQTWLHERMKISLREWLSHKLLDHWLQPGRAYRLAITSDTGVNPDQRIQEDVRNFSEGSADLSIGLTQSSLLLVSFIGVLWAMSSGIKFEVSGHMVQIPGYMVWVAILYAIIGSWVTARVGRPLIKLNEERYAHEGDFRFSIVRVSESSESIGFYSGEKDERKIINKSLGEVLEITRKSSGALARLTWITSGYGWLMLLVPVLVALPGYLQGALDLGGLMMVVGAFGQVQNSLRWFVDNFARIADWRAALHRVVVFRDAMRVVDEYENSSAQIELVDHPEGHLQFDHTKVSLIDGEVVIADATAHIRPGERVLIMGPSGSGKSTLLRAVGGLWPWGSGKIHLPPRDQIMFLPQKPYMPMGTLAEALNYPVKHAGYSREEMGTALARVNLEEFIPLLDQLERWDKLMSLGQQQRLAFARLLLHKPKWVFLDEATSALDDQNQHTVMTLFTEELHETALLSIGHRPGLSDYHTRTLHLTATGEGTILRRRPKPERISIWNKAKGLVRRPVVNAGAISAP